MRFAAFSLFVTIAVASAAEQPASDARALIDKSLAAEADNRSRMVNYLFLEEITRRSFNREKKMVQSQSSAFEVLFIEGKPAFRRVSINGRPLTEEEERAETARLRQLAEDRRRNTGIPSAAEERRRFHPFALFRIYHEFRMAGEESMEGRDCWVIESKPRRGAPKPQSADSERIASASAKFWIDKETLNRVRMDVTALKPGSAAKVNEYTSYRWGQRDGSVWLITAIKAVLPLPGNGKTLAYYESEQRYSNYRRFTSESSVSSVEELPVTTPN